MRGLTLGLGSLLWILTANAWAQTTSFPLVAAIPATAWAAGIGSAGIALPGFAGSIFGNPAGLASIPSVGVEAAWNRLSRHSTYTMAAVGARRRKIFLGAGGQLITGSSEVAPTGSTIAGSLGYAKGLVATGMTVRHLEHHDPSSERLSGTAADLGAILAVFDIAAVGFEVENLVQSSQLDLLGMTRVWRVGLSMNFLDTYSNGRLMGTIETAWADQRRRITTAGVEAAMVVKGVGILGRLGRAGSAGITPQTSYGASVLLGRARVDYGYLRNGPLGGEFHQVGVRWTP